MQSYLLTVLIKEKLDEKGRSGLIDDVKKNFSNIVKEDIWGVRGLAYPIKHNDKAFYAHFDFEAEPEKIINIDRSLRLNEDVLRYLIVKSKKVKIRKGKAKTEVKGDGETVKAKDKLEAESGKSEEAISKGKEEKAEKKVTKAKK